MGSTPYYGARAEKKPQKSRFCHEANEYNVALAAT